MRIKSQRDFWAGLLFLVTGSAFALGAQSYGFGSSAQPGPGFFPFWLGLLLGLLGALVLFAALSFESADGDPIGPIAWRPLLVLCAAVALFGLLLPRLGLLMSLPPLVLLASAAGDEFRWREALLNCAVLTAACWGIFIWGLKLTIPFWPVFWAP